MMYLDAEQTNRPRGRSRNRKGSPAVWAVVACCILGVAGAASSDPETLEPLIVSANRIEQPLDRLGVSGKLLDGDWLEEAAYPGLAEGLQTVPGVSLRQVGGRGATRTLNIRGLRDRDSLVRVDWAKGSGGVITGFTPYLAYAMPLNIERVEVVTGAQSVLYGSDALGGVVTILTRRGRGRPSFRAWAEGGSFESRRAALTGEGETGRLAWSFHGGWESTANERPENDYENRGYSVRLDYRLNADWEAGVLSRGHRASYDDPPVPSLLIGAAKVETTNLAATAYLEGRLADRVRSRWTASWFREDYDADFSGFAYLGDSDIFLADWETQWYPENGYRWVGGVSMEVSRQKDNFFPDGYEESTHGGAYLQSIWEASPEITVSAGARYDWVERFNDPWTWRANLAWRPGDGRLKWRVAAGNSFRAPNVFQLFSSFAGGGNRALDPETGLAAEAGVDVRLDDRGGRLSLTLFRHEVRDLIVDIDPSPTAIRPENRDRAESYGVEAAWTWRPATAPMALTLAYTWLRARTTVAEPGGTTTEDRRDIPRQQLDADWRYFIGDRGSHIGAGLHWIEGRPGNYASFLDPADLREDSYAIFRLYGQWAFRPQWRIMGRLENALDREYFASPGYPGLGRAGHVGIEYQW